MKKNLINIANKALFTTILAASTIMGLTSCGDEGGKETPVIPVGQNHVVKLYNTKDIGANLSGIAEKSNAKENTVLVEMHNDYGIKSSDFVTIQEFLDLVNNRSNVSIKTNSNKLYSDEAKQILSAENAKLLTALVAGGMVLSLNPVDNEMFWIHSKDAANCTDNMLKFMGYSDGVNIAFNNSADFNSKFSDVIARADMGEKYIVEFPEIEIGATMGAKFRAIKNHKNISVLPGYKISVKTDANPVPASDINAFYDYSGGVVNLIITKNAKTVSGYNHIMANDSTLDILKTRSTLSKSTGHINTLDENNNIIDPAIGMYDLGANWELIGIKRPDNNGLSVDGYPLQKLDIKRLCIGGGGNENGGFYMLDASVRMINERFTDDGIHFRYPVMADGVQLVPTADEKYNAKYTEELGKKEVTATAIKFNDVHFNPITSRHTGFQRVFYGSKNPSFGADAVTFVFLPTDMEHFFNFGIYGESLGVLTKELRKGFVRAGYSLPDAQHLIYAWPEMVQTKYLPLTLYDIGRGQR